MNVLISTIQNRNFVVIMKKHYLQKALMHTRFLGITRGKFSFTRCFSTDKNSEGQSNESQSSPESSTEKEAIEQTETKPETSDKAKLSGFAQSYEKFSHIDDKKPDIPQTFASLIRNSKFIDLGDPEGKVVIGKIFHIVDNDLYIDFGWKFHCVCKKPAKNEQYYVRGSKVRLRIKDLEMSSRFLGATTDITLLEADCTLMGLISSPLQMAEQRSKAVDRSVIQERK